MILYDYVLSASCFKVRLMAALTGQVLDVRAVNFHPERAHKKPPVIALNPAGTLPVLVDGDVVLADSAAILRHLTRALPDWQSDADERWLALAAEMNGSLGLARLHDILGYPAEIDRVRAAGIAALRRLEAHLTEQRFDGHLFLTGARPTIADIACFPNVALAPDGGVSIDPYPAIRHWTRAIRALPGFIEMPGIFRLHELVDAS